MVQYTVQYMHYCSDQIEKARKIYWRLTRNPVFYLLTGFSYLLLSVVHTKPEQTDGKQAHYSSVTFLTTYVLRTV